MFKLKIDEERRRDKYSTLCSKIGAQKELKIGKAR